MRTDFIFVIGQIAEAYTEVKCSWQLKDIIRVFRCYYDYYRYFRDADHPRMKTKTIRQMIQALSYADCEDGTGFDLWAEEYIESLIPLYFETFFGETTDYCMPHFMSGHIRGLLLTRAVHEDISTQWDEKRHEVIGDVWRPLDFRD